MRNELGQFIPDPEHPAKPTYIYLERRKKRMAEMMDSARRKYEGLIREAKRYGMTDLLTNEELYRDSS